MRDIFLATKENKIWTIMVFKYKSIHVGLQDVSEHALQKRVIYHPKNCDLNVYYCEWVCIHMVNLAAQTAQIKFKYFEFGIFK